jgi:hypothetical protein
MVDIRYFDIYLLVSTGTMINMRNLLKVAHPGNLILASLSYSLGAGIARYLGHPLNSVSLGLGLLLVLLVQSASYYLVEYFHLPTIPLSER